MPGDAVSLESILFLPEPGGRFLLTECGGRCDVCQSNKMVTCCRSQYEVNIGGFAMSSRHVKDSNLLFDVPFCRSHIS